MDGILRVVVLPFSMSGEFAVVFGFFYYPGGALGNFASAESRFEGIEFAFQVTSLFAEDDEARARDRGHHGGAEERANVVWVMEENVEGVVGGEAGAFDANVGGDGLWRAEKRQGLIEEMRREIEENAAAGAGLFAPGVGLGRGTEAIVSGFEADDAAEVACGDGLAEGLEIGVEAAVVVDGENAVLFLARLRSSTASATVVVKGLSTTTCLPASRARFASG